MTYTFSLQFLDYEETALDVILLHYDVMEKNEQDLNFYQLDYGVCVCIHVKGMYTPHTHNHFLLSLHHESLQILLGHVDA